MRSKMYLLAAVIGLIFVAQAGAKQNINAGFLTIWPTPRSTGLAGAMTALADDADAAFFNPGGLGFNNGFTCVLSVTPSGWLPGLWPGMYYAYGSAGFGFEFSPGFSLNAGTNISYLTTGVTDVINERGELLGRYRVWDAAFGVHGGVGLVQRLGAGVNLKLIRSYLVPDWVWKEMPELGIELGGTGSAIGCDFGILYKPFDFLNLGASVANIGPNIFYASSGESKSLPWMLRVGVAYYPVKSEFLTICITPELNKILVGIFSDETKTLPEQFSAEWRNAWKSLGTEGQVNIGPVSGFLRIAYFEDISGQRGGFVFERGGQKYHHSVFDLFTIPVGSLGRLSSIGICIGAGLGINNFLRFDFATDALLYSFSTSNWKIGLAINNLPDGLINYLKDRSKIF